MPRRLRIQFPASTPPPANTPLWVQNLTPWQFTDITGTRYTDHMKDDGSGIVPAHGGPVHTGDSANYIGLFGDSGPNYTMKFHELYLSPSAGGHKGSSSNVLVRWNLWKDSPDMEMVLPPTPWATRRAEVDQSGVFNATYADSRNGYFSDGAPHAGHTYSNVNWLDAIDEQVAVCISAGNSAFVGTYHWRVGVGYRRGDTWWRPKKYWPDLPVQRVGETGPGVLACTFPSYNKDAIYMTRDTGPLWRLDGITRAWTDLGGPDLTWQDRAMGAAHPDGQRALIAGKHDDWRNYYLRWVNLNTGVQTPTPPTYLTVTGYVLPQVTVHPIRDMKYIDILNGYVALYVAGDPTTATPGTWNLVLFREVNSTTMSAQELISTVCTGSPPVDDQWRTYLYYDKDYQVLILGNGATRPLKALKLTAL